MTALLLAACGERAALPEHGAGTALPPAVLQPLDGGPAVDLSRYRGKALVVNFWATWCEPCRKEMPTLEALHRRADPARAAVIGISVDADVNLARELVLKNGLTFPTYSDRDMAYARGALELNAFPATFLVAPDGRIVERIVGIRDWSDPASTRSLKPAFD